MVEVPRPSAPQIIVDENGRATKEFQWYLFQMWLRTGGAADDVAGALVSGNNLSDVASAGTSRVNLGFSNPILDKTAPGNIGGVTPGSFNGTSGTFSTTLSAIGNITSSTGDIVSTLGLISAATTITAGGDISSTTGDISSVAGALSAATTLTITGKFFVDANENVAVGDAALATTATDGFFYIPTSAGNPTGTPTAKTGLAPMVYDSTNNELFIYNGSWRSAVFT